MAFFNRASSILWQAASKNINHEISASKPSIFKMIRCMSAFDFNLNPSDSELRFSGLKYDTDDTSLREAFKKYGDVIEAKVLVNEKTGRPNGFGFVSFSDPKAASAASRGIRKQEIPEVFRVKVDHDGFGCSFIDSDDDVECIGEEVGYGSINNKYDYIWGGSCFAPKGPGTEFDYVRIRRDDGSVYAGKLSDYRGGSFSDAGGFGADGNRQDQFGTSGGLSNLGGSDGGCSQQDAGISSGDDAQAYYANTKAQ